MISLRARVVVASTLIVAVSLLIGGCFIALVRSQAMEDGLAALARSRLAALAASLEAGHNQLVRHAGGDLGPGTAWSLRSADGRLLQGPAWLGPAPPEATVAAPILAPVSWPDGSAGLAAWAWASPEVDTVASPAPDADDTPVGTAVGPVSVALAVPRGDLDHQLAVMRTTLLGGGLLTALLAAGALALVLDRLLRPHAALADAISQLDPRRSGQRLPEAELPAELRPVAGRVNELIDRLGRAHGLASSFHAAAAHELRTPLAGLRATIEVAQNSGADPAAALVTCHQIALQMQARVDNLLTASRLDAGQIAPRREEVDVHDLLRQAWEAQAVRGADRGLEAVWDLTGAGIAEADPEALRMVVANLLDNAVSHSTQPGGIVITSREVGGWTELRITNPSTIRPEDAAKVFDRGWRGAAASDSQRHAGMGMGISRELIALMGGRIEVAAFGNRFTVTLTLPAPGAFAYW